MEKLELETKIEKLFLDLGAIKVTLKNGSFYEKDNFYYKISYLKSLDSYVIEYAESKEEAENNLLEDGDTYPLSLGNDLINTLEKDLKKYYLN